MTITAAVDGSALGNPGPAGWSWVISEDVWDSGGWPTATNNVGELTAVLELLRATRQAGLANEPLVILADSQYAINCITKWMPGWKRRGWKKADGKPVANREILEAIDREIVGRNFKFEWIKGHAGHALNELADERARAAATAYQKRLAPPGGPGLNAVVTSAGMASAGVASEDAPDSPVAAFAASDPAVITDADARSNWLETLDRAYTEPITIVAGDGREFLLCNAAHGKGMLASRDEAPPTLF